MDFTRTLSRIEENSLAEIANIIMNTFKFDYLMNLEAKINFTAIIYMNRDLIVENQDFYEEECHLCLVNWIYDYSDKLKSEDVVDEKIFHLIYNILIIFEILPIKVNDLFELKIFEKLNKIRKYIKNKNLNSYNHLDRLITYWNKFCTDNPLYMKPKRDSASCIELDSELYNPKKKVNYHLNFQVCLDEEYNIHTTSQNILSSNKLNSGILKKYSNLKNIKSIKWNDQELTKIKIFNISQSPDESDGVFEEEKNLVINDEKNSIRKYIKIDRKNRVDDGNKEKLKTL
jgi:hypothetical protein